MAKSFTLSLAQWIFLLAVIWVSTYFAAIFLEKRGEETRPAPSSAEVVPDKETAAEEAGSQWLPPVEVAEPSPVYPSREKLAAFEGQSAPEIISALQAETNPEAAEFQVIRFEAETDRGIAPPIPFVERSESARVTIGAANELSGASRLGLADLDGDGLRDIQAPARPGSRELQLLRNLGDGTFEADAGSFAAGVRVMPADFDNDGDRDLYVMRPRLPDSLLVNDGEGGLSDRTVEAGLSDLGWSVSADWVDFDRDGRLDLFVAHNPETYGSGEPSARLFHNRGDGRFREVAWSAGLRFSAYVRDSTWGDIDSDGFPDLMVSCADLPDEVSQEQSGGEATLFLFRSVPANDLRNWRFESVEDAVGLGEVEDAGRVIFGDIDQDGALDLLAGGGVWSGLRLFRNQDGWGTFEEVTEAMGLEGVDGVLAMEPADVDGDGHQDLFLGTRENSGNRILFNRGGDRFREANGAAGGFGILQGSPAIGAGDLDGDGDLDLLAAADWTKGALLENPGAPGHRWITLDLEGDSANRSAIGARISLIVRDHDWILHRIERVAREPRVEIGLGRAASIESLEIKWPVIGWPRSEFTGLPLDRRLRIREGATEFEVIDTRPFQLGGGERDASDSGGS